MRVWQGRLAVFCLSGLLAIAFVACSVPQTESLEVPELPTMPEQSLKPLETAEVIYLGERHDSKADHQAQLEIIQALHRTNPNLAIAMEMFQRPFQGVLDRYIAGEMTETELIRQSEYDTRWGFPWELYAPILRFARDNNIPVLAINAPGEVVNKVAREGLAQLTPEDFRYLPPLTELDLGNAEYRNFIAGAFAGHGDHGNFNLDNFFAAQVVWDETMAMAIANYHRTHPHTKIITLAGQGHVMYGYGIPDRVKRRLGEDLNAPIVLLNPAPELTLEGQAIADMYWWSQKTD